MEKTVEKLTKAKTLTGVVVSDKMDKTVVVSVSRLIKHPKYGKFIARSKRYKAHDENNECKVGDKVVIKSCRSMSKDKSFVVVK
jgi:small subunit ribosomal protein S17